MKLASVNGVNVCELVFLCEDVLALALTFGLFIRYRCTAVVLDTNTTVT